MSENQRIIEKIIFSFKEEMSRIEHGNIFTLLARENPPTPQEMFTRQKAEKAVDEALEKLTEKLKGHGNITVDLEF